MTFRRLLGMLLLAACAQKDPVVHTIDRITEAAEDRDAAEVASLLSSRYTGQNGGRSEVERELRRYFFGYRSIDITVRELRTESSATGGSATFRVDFAGLPKQAGGFDQYLPRSATYRFAVDLVPEEGQWKISSAQWERER